MRNPHEVLLHLGSLKSADKKGDLHPLYTEKQIEEILAKNFGPDWRKQWRRRIAGRSQNT
jgi:hypothetical protein